MSAAYSVTLAATGGTGTYTWALTSGTLPNGFTLSSAGVISGTSLGPPSTSSPVITVTDSAAATAVRTFSITISPGTSAIITTSPLTSGQLGTAYSLTFVGAGPPPAYTWTLDSGSLPTGLALSTAGVLSGTPTALGSYSFTIRFTATNSTTVAKAFTMSVVNPLTISSTSPLTSGTAGTAYSQTLAATGGTSVYTWSVSAGTLPTGLAFTSAGVLSGTPTAAGTFNFTAQVADTGGLSTTKAFAVTIVNPLTITSTSPLVGGTTGTAYSQTLAASGGVTAYTWSTASGTVPTGLSLSSAGVLSGTPAVAGSFTFTAQVTDSASFSTAATFVVTVVDPLSITTTSPLAGGVTGTAYSQTFTATGGTSPYTWNLSAGTVPTGLTLSTAGVLSGTPTATGTFSFTVRAADSGGLTATKAFAATVIDPLAAFLAAYGLSSASDDSDGDGISNLMEFLLGGNPTAPNTGILPTASKTTVNGNPALVFSFYVTTAPGAVTWAVEYSSDLSTWTTAVHGENGITITSASAGAGLNLITVTIPTTESKCVARLRVTPP